MKPMYPLIPAVLIVLTACSSTPSDPASFDQLFGSFNDIDAAADALPPTNSADLAAATGDATYTGLAYVRDYQSGNLSGLRFMAVGEATVQADLDTLAMSGTADTFYEIDLAQSDLNATDPAAYVTQPIAGSLASSSTADGWQGTLTQSSGVPIAFDMQVYNTAFLGPDLQLLLIEADGTADTNITSIGTFEFIGHDPARGPLAQ